MNIFAVLPTESKKGKKLGPRNKNKIKRPDTIVEEQQIQQALETQSVHSEDSYVPQGYFHPGHWMGFSLDPPFAPAQVKNNQISKFFSDHFFNPNTNFRFKLLQDKRLQPFQWIFTDRT